ncbi:SsrA-binding protein SmpB [Candidatus Parcubacteria bacterium]|nr:SsrA-binding protein SmpB [Candidatus Parcubacteria bacterium]
MKILAENKKAYFDYEILEKFEAGISLLGTEVKSLKFHGVNLRGSYVIIKGGEAFWVGVKIPPWQPKNVLPSYKDQRDRKLLLRKKELKYLIGKTKEKGLTLIPLRLYNKGRWIKLEFALAKKKKKFKKKEEIKQRAIEEEIQRTLKQFR